MQSSISINQVPFYPNLQELKEFTIHTLNVKIYEYSESYNFSQYQVSSDSTELIDYIDYDQVSNQQNDLISEFETLRSQTPQLAHEIQQSENVFEIEKKKSSMLHVDNEAKKRRKKQFLQKTCQNGYFTNNFLPIGKNSQFKWIVKKMGYEFIQNNPILLAIKKKNGISLPDYLLLYTMKELREIWVEYFSKKVLYRDLMLSRAEKMSKIIFETYLYRFQEAYETGDFENIA